VLPLLLVYLSTKHRKNKVLIFNKSGRHIKEPLYFKNELIESVNKYKYLGAIFQSSGLLNYAKEELCNKSLKASYKLSRCLSGSAASIKTNLHLFDHTIKPIDLYGSEIWGMFRLLFCMAQRYGECLDYYFVWLRDMFPISLSHTK
jgi:hypothetical protein